MLQILSLKLDYSCAPHGNLTIDKWVPNHEDTYTGDNRLTNGCTMRDQLRATSSTADDSYIFESRIRCEYGNPVTAVRDNWILV